MRPFNADICCGARIHRAGCRSRLRGTCRRTETKRRSSPVTKRPWCTLTVSDTSLFSLLSSLFSLLSPPSSLRSQKSMRDASLRTSRGIDQPTAPSEHKPAMFADMKLTRHETDRAVGTQTSDGHLEKPTAPSEHKPAMVTRETDRAVGTQTSDGHSRNRPCRRNTNQRWSLDGINVRLKNTTPHSCLTVPLKKYLR
jgi:hypothetical protein